MAAFDRFDICEAWYCYACEYHAGQWSKLYAVFGRLNAIKFKPRHHLTADQLEGNAREIYDSLVERRVHQ